ncbi:Replicative DNA helicase [subsurface metagenome]
MFKKNIGIDELIVIKEINKNELKMPGDYIYGLISSVPCRGENYRHYNSIIKKKSVQRKILAILEDTREGKIEMEGALLEIEKLPGEDIKEEAFSIILENTLKDSIRGTEYRFKISSLNHYLGGADKGELITIGGWTSQGKSTLAIQLAIDFASGGKKVLYLSTEMTPIEVGRRILSNLNKKNIMDFRKGKFEKGEKEALQSIIDIISKISGKWEMNIKKVNDMNDVAKYVRKYRPEIIFVDYLQNMGGNVKFSDYQRATYNIRELQNLTLREEIVTFVLSQLSRDKEIRTPRLADLRDSGRIEECSNMVIFLYWEDRLKEKIKHRKGGEPAEKLEIRIGKNRDGTIGRFYLDFYPEWCRLEDEERGEHYEY